MSRQECSFRAIIVRRCYHRVQGLGLRASIPWFEVSMTRYYAVIQRGFCEVLKGTLGRICCQCVDTTIGSRIPKVLMVGIEMHSQSGLKGIHGRVCC